jgi:hypothetical protein
MNISDTVLLPVAVALCSICSPTGSPTDPRELPPQHAGEHPVHHRALQRVAVSEVLVGRVRQILVVD